MAINKITLFYKNQNYLKFIYLNIVLYILLININQVRDGSVNRIINLSLINDNCVLGKNMNNETLQIINDII